MKSDGFHFCLIRFQLSYRIMSSYFSSWLADRKRLINSYMATLVALSVLVCVPAHGLSVVPRTFDELVERADLVLGGTVKEVHSQFADNGLDQNTIFSYVTLTNLEVVKGRVTTSDYVLRVPGGVMGRFAQDYPGIPKFQIGQSYLVFIRGNRRDFFPAVGIGQGVFRILTNALGQRVVIRDDRLCHAGQRALSAMTQDAPTLDDFIQNIRARLTPDTPAAKGSSP